VALVGMAVCVVSVFLVNWRVSGKSARWPLTCRHATCSHREQDAMSGRQSIEYRDASAEVRAVFDDIKRTRRVDDVNNFWKYLGRCNTRSHWSR
jgi:hypothetical protein